ncbi:MAG: sodium:solute symporter family protein [Bdellovibrionota bacterium]
MFLSKIDGYIVFAIFALSNIFITCIFNVKNFNIDTFLVANRSVPWIFNGLSIAATWIWGPALFLSSSQAFTSGYVGVFWFLLPNFTCFYIYIFFAQKFKNYLPYGYTLAEFMRKKYKNNTTVHFTYILLILLCQITALVLNSVIGAKLISMLTGINTNVVILLIIAITTAYSLISGFQASIITDCFEMIIIYAFIIIIIPIAIYKTGGIETIRNNIGGLHNNINLLDINTIKYFAIPSFITLWTGPITDQMFFQRVMGSNKNNVTKSFLSASLMYIIVPFALSLLGYIGVELFRSGKILLNDEQLIGGIVISSLFEKFVISFYCITILAGLCSTIDSALCATCSIGYVDIYETYLKKNKKLSAINISRLFIISIAIISTIIAFLKPNLKAMFFIIGTIRAAGFFPTILTLFGKLSLPIAIPFAIGSAIFLSLPLSIYSNLHNIEDLVIISSLSALIFPLIIFYVGYIINKRIRRLQE